jgi:hypothetical protein
MPRIPGNELKTKAISLPGGKGISNLANILIIILECDELTKAIVVEI